MSDRIALFMPSLAGGGAERVMVNLARGIVERGFQVDMVVAQAEGPYVDELPSQARIVDLAARRVATSLFALSRYLREVRPRSLLSAQTHANIIALWARRVAGVDTRVVVSEHVNLGHSVKYSVRLSDRLMPYFVKKFYPWSDEVIAVSRGVADDLVDNLGVTADRIRVIYNPVVTPWLQAKTQERPDHAWLRDNQPPVVLGVGRLTEQKDFHTLIHAFADVQRKKDARLIILGEGEERPTLERLVTDLGLNDRVDMPGFVSNPFAYMAQSDVFALSSRWEGLATVIIEAMACGTTVVSTDCPSGPTEILENGKYGTLVPVGNAVALGQAILAALDVPRDPAVLMQRANDFSIDRITDEYLQVLSVAS